jgi:sugar (pentulose or hexulose) kinase
VTGLPVVAPRVTEAASWGAALLAGIGAGHFISAAQASEETVHLERWYEPDPGRSARYQERFELYRQVYPALKEIHHRM